MAPRPAHFKRTVSQGDGMRDVYACTVHEPSLREQRDGTPVAPVESFERNQASVWCTFCEEEQSK